MEQHVYYVVGATKGQIDWDLISVFQARGDKISNTAEDTELERDSCEGHCHCH